MAEYLFISIFDHLEKLKKNKVTRKEDEKLIDPSVKLVTGFNQRQLVDKKP